MRCPLCHEGAVSPFHRDQRRSYLRCASCALVFVPARYRLCREAERAEYDLHQNAVACRGHEQRFDYRGKTFTFNGTKTTNYRVYCRQVLQQEFNALTEQDQRRINRLFEPSGGLGSLHADGIIDSGIADHFVLPRDPASAQSQTPGLMKGLLGQPRN